MIDQAIIDIVLMSSGGVIGVIVVGTLMIRISCWLYNKVNGVAAPGLGRKDSRDYTLVRPEHSHDHTPPEVFTRYERTTTSGVPVPGILKSLLLSLAVIMGWAIVAGVIFLVLFLAASATNSTFESALMLSGFISIPVYLLLLSAALTVFLPTRFYRGLLVAGLNVMLFIAAASLISAVVICAVVSLGAFAIGGLAAG